MRPNGVKIVLLTLLIATVFLIFLFLFYFTQYINQSQRADFFQEESYNFRGERDVLINFIENEKYGSGVKIGYYSLTNNKITKEKVFCIDYNDKDRLYCNFIYSYVHKDKITFI